MYRFNHLNAELNPTCHLLALLGAHHIFHVSGLRVNSYRHAREREWEGTEEKEIHNKKKQKSQRQKERKKEIKQE